MGLYFQISKEKNCETKIIYMEKFSFKNEGALTSVAQLVGHHPEKQKVTGLIPGQGTCLDCGFGPCLRGV